MFMTLIMHVFCKEKVMLKYEEKLHFDKYYNKLQSTSVLHKVISLVCNVAGYIVIYYFIKYFLTSLPDFRPWSNSVPWLSLGGVLFSKIDLIYFTCGLILICYGSIKLSKITIQNHSVRNEKSNTPERLLVTGYYAKVRHPMYGTFIIMQAGFMLSLRSLGGIIIACIIFAFQYVNAVVEEKRLLLPTFGEEYKTYVQNVGRMLLTRSEVVALSLIMLLSAVGFLF
jgi:protein-S-isoprenylcysteine O-methyltransferase Ste14